MEALPLKNEKREIGNWSYGIKNAASASYLEQGQYIREEWISEESVMHTLTEINIYLTKHYSSWIVKRFKKTVLLLPILFSIYKHKILSIKIT